MAEVTSDLTYEALGAGAREGARWRAGNGRMRGRIRRHLDPQARHPLNAASARLDGRLGRIERRLPLADAH